MRKIILKQTLGLLISLITHHNVINAMKRNITKMSNYQKIAVQNPSQKLKLEDIFSCYLCSKKFTNQADYTIHINAHIPLEVRIKNAFIRKFNARIPTPMPTQKYTYIPLEELPFAASIQELEWI